MTKKATKGIKLLLLALLTLSLSPTKVVSQTVDTVPATPIVLRETACHSPQKALLLSTFLPGAGQVYNQQAWKIPIVYAALGAGAYFIGSNYGKMKKFKEEYLYRVRHDDTPQSNAYATYPTANVFNMYEVYNQRFQLSIIVTVGLWGLNMLDAFVFGHLFEYDMGNEITLQCGPLWQYDPLAGAVPSAGISIRF
ncbi:MAG: DUF5683 domain-containing protein [Bacteroidales bacterium]|nr:DUF5683 domain-containing protein [Bacteroidales bacterium]